MEKSKEKRSKKKQENTESPEDKKFREAYEMVLDYYGDYPPPEKYAAED